MSQKVGIEHSFWSVISILRPVETSPTTCVSVCVWITWLNIFEHVTGMKKVLCKQGTVWAACPLAVCRASKKTGQFACISRVFVFSPWGHWRLQPKKQSKPHLIPKQHCSNLQGVTSWTKKSGTKLGLCPEAPVAKVYFTFSSCPQPLWPDAHESWKTSGRDRFATELPGTVAPNGVLHHLKDLRAK